MEEFAAVPLRFFEQITRCIKHGNLLSVEDLADLPRDFTEQAPLTDARFAFFAGEDNLCFLPESQVKSYEYFSAHRQNFHSLNILPNYGHLDVFMGKHAARDTFPLIIQELAKS
jgi:hypothetical protein